MKLRYPIIAALCALSAYGGYRYEASFIQGTCESSDAPTWLNGQLYVCEPYVRALQNTQRAQGERGA